MVECLDFDLAYSHHSPGTSSGGASARVGLSQKGDLPSSGEPLFSVGPRSPTRAMPIMGKAPGAWNQASRVPGAKGVLP